MGIVIADIFDGDILQMIQFTLRRTAPWSRIAVFSQHFPKALSRLIFHRHQTLFHQIPSWFKVVLSQMRLSHHATNIRQCIA